MIIFWTAEIRYDSSLKTGLEMKKVWNTYFVILLLIFVNHIGGVMVSMLNIRPLNKLVSINAL
jgi:hypothetical protein